MRHLPKGAEEINYAKTKDTSKAARPTNSQFQSDGSPQKMSKHKDRSMGSLGAATADHTMPGVLLCLPEIQEAWEAVLAMCKLFGETAEYVAEQLGYRHIRWRQ